MTSKVKMADVDVAYFTVKCQLIQVSEQIGVQEINLSLVTNLFLESLFGPARHGFVVPNSDPRDRFVCYTLSDTYNLQSNWKL